MPMDEDIEASHRIDLENQLNAFELTLWALKTRKHLENTFNAHQKYYQEYYNEEVVEPEAQSKEAHQEWIKHIAERGLSNSDAASSLLDKAIDFKTRAREAKEKSTPQNLLDTLGKIKSEYNDAYYNVPEIVGVVRDLLEHKTQFVNAKTKLLIRNLNELIDSPIFNNKISMKRDACVYILLRDHKKYLPKKHNRLKYHKL